jgi:hypothetical protein
MKNTLLLSALMFFASTGFFAQNKTNAPVGSETTTPVSPTAPEITFEVETHDFGTLQKGAPCEYDFKFKNTGKEPLIIQNAQASCGCTVPQWPKEPIMPGQTGMIKVKYDSNRIGAFTKTVTITSNAKTASKFITIKGNVEGPPQEEQFPGNNNKPQMPN